jgi:chaperone modulatory protein CbpM
MTKTTLHITLQEFCELHGVSERQVAVAVEHGIALPVAGSAVPEWVFDTAGAMWIRRAIRLQRDLEMDWVAVALVVDLLRQREHLQLENRRLRQRLRRFALEDLEE